MGCCNSKETTAVSVQLHYHSSAGSLVSYDSSQEISSRIDEAKFVAGFDESYMQPNGVMYVIDAKWLKKWHDYSQGIIDRSKVGNIDNKGLCADSVSLRGGLVLKHDYLPVCIEVWEYYFTHYGGGPVIYFYVPSGFADKAYRSGKWLNDVDLSEQCDVIYPLPMKDKAPYQKDISEFSSSGQNVSDNQIIAASHMTSDVGKSKIQEGMALQKDITDGNAELIASSMLQDQASRKFTEANALDDDIHQQQNEVMSASFTSDLGDAKIKAAKQLNEEAQRLEAENIASRQLADDLADMQEAEASRLDSESKHLEAENMARLLADDLSKKQMAEARQKDQDAKEEQNERLLELFKSLGAKARYKAALAHGNMDVATDAAAAMLQAAWRSKLANRRVALLKAERERLKKESCARRLQSKYRARLARKRAETLRAERDRLLQESCACRLQNKYRERLARRKVDALRAEKQRLMEEGCAIKLQGRWRLKLAQRRVAALKAEQRRLREEGAALRLQSAIRIRKAKQRVTALRAEKQRLLEEGSALMLQSAWRIKQARKRLGGLKKDKKGAMVFQALWRAKVGRKKAMCAKQAVTLINRFVRGCLARGHFRLALRSHHPHTLVVRLRNASDINIGDIKTSDPYVHVTNLERVHAHAKATARDPFPSPVDMDVKLRVASQYKTETKSSTLTPVWDEDALLPAVQLDSTLVLSMYDHDLVNKDDLLGQNSLDVKDINQLYSGKSISFENTAIGDYLYPVYDSSGKALTTSGDGEMKGKGHLSFSIRLSSLAYSMSGWLQKTSNSFMSNGQFHNRWVVLHDFEINYYEDPYHMNVSKGTLHCKDVTALSVKDETFTLHCAKEKNSWHFAFEVPAHHAAYNEMWLRKLIRSCPNVRDPASMALIGLPAALWDQRSVDHITHGTAPTLNIARSGSYDTSFESPEKTS